MSAVHPGEVAGASVLPLRAARSRPQPERIVRFHLAERTMHWAIAVPFMVCFATALVLVLAYNPDPTRAGRAAVSWIHRLSGLFLIALPLASALRFRREKGLHLENFRAAWRWRRDEIRWLLLMVPAMFSSRVALPEEGKFNAAEKLNFMMVSCAYPLFAITGLLIWLPGVAFYSWLAHFAMAIVATPLMLGHVFMATVNPATRRGLSGMIDGTVEAEWAGHHYRAWYREHLAAAPPPAASCTLGNDGNRPGALRCPACSKERQFASWTEIVAALRSSAALVCTACESTIEAISITTDPHTLARIIDGLDGVAEP